MELPWFCWAVSGHVPEVEECDGGTVWAADGFCISIAQGLLSRSSPAVPPHSHACMWNCTIYRWNNCFEGLSPGVALAEHSSNRLTACLRNYSTEIDYSSNQQLLVLIFNLVLLFHPCHSLLHISVFFSLFCTHLVLFLNALKMRYIVNILDWWPFVGCWSETFTLFLSLKMLPDLQIISSTYLFLIIDF